MWRAFNKSVQFAQKVFFFKSFPRRANLTMCLPKREHDWFQPSAFRWWPDDFLWGWEWRRWRDRGCFNSTRTRACNECWICFGIVEPLKFQVRSTVSILRGLGGKGLLLVLGERNQKEYLFGSWLPWALQKCQKPHLVSLTDFRGGGSIVENHGLRLDEVLI